MSWMAVAGIATSVVGAATSYIGGKKAGRAAKDAAAAEAEIEDKITDERIRQIGREEDLMSEATIARTAGSGVKVGGESMLQVLAEQAAEFRREKDITREVGASRASTALQRGSALATQYKYQGLSGAASGIGSAFKIAATTDWKK